MIEYYPLNFGQLHGLLSKVGIRFKCIYLKLPFDIVLGLLIFIQ